jgi:hypothetical protein
VAWCKVLCCLFVLVCLKFLRWFGRGKVVKPSAKSVKEGRGPWEGLMDREIWCTSGLSIRAWEIGAAGARNGEGGQGTSSTYLFRRQSRHHLDGTYRFLLRAQLARAREGRCQGSPGRVQ